MSELKPGDTMDFTIGDKTLKLEPVPYGNIKKIVRIAFNASESITSGDLKSVPDLIDKNIGQIMPLLFVSGRYDFLTTEWIENNMTVPTLRKMVEAAVVINGLQDFFDKATGKGSDKVTPPPNLETLPANPGSTTSADSVTDGGPKT